MHRVNPTHPPHHPPATRLPSPTRTRLHRGWLAIVALLALLTAGPATHAAGLLIADGGHGGVLEVQQHDVRVVINNGVAVTTVEQHFRNTENRVVEALYTFPVPKGASVANFSMWINGKEMIGEVVEKQRARQIYESYKPRRVDPGLLEQVDHKRFEMRIFPIAAGATQRVRIAYYQELDVDHDWATYVYPLATVTRKDMDERTAGRFSLTVDVKSEVPIAEVNSPSHKDGFAIAKHTDRYVQASYEVGGNENAASGARVRRGNLSRDLVLAYRLARPKTGMDAIFSRTGKEDGYFQLTLTAGDDVGKFDQGMDYVFVLDVSGSMARDAKLEMSRRSLDAFFDALGPKDRFEVITFNNAARTLFNRLNPADPKSREQAVSFLNNASAVGGTMLAPALQTAYRYLDTDRPLNVVVLSDGLTEQNEQRELLNLIGKRPQGVSLFAIGVGNEVNRPLMRQLAEETGGLASFISRGDDFERQAQAFRRKLTRPVLSDVKFRIDGGDVYDIEPEAIPNLYHGTPIRIYGRYRNAGKAKVNIEASISGKQINRSFEITLPKSDDDNPQIERMWAWHRVQQLMREQRRSGSQSMKSDIVALCESYSIVSEFASFIVLENDGEYQRWKIQQRNASRIQRDRRALEKVRTEMRQLQAEAMAKLGPQGNTDSTRQMASSRQAGSKPGATRQPSNATSPRISQPAPRRNSVDWNFGPTGDRSGSRSGGGALGPMEAITIALLTGGIAVGNQHRRRRRRGDDTDAETTRKDK